MLKTGITHPEILEALGSAGHLSKVLISDGNFPHRTVPGKNCKFVYANFMPGVLDATTILRGIASVIPIETVHVMAPETEGAYAMDHDPPIWESYRKVLAEDSDFDGELTAVTKPECNDLCRDDHVCLCIATGEQGLFANILLTIGVVKPDKG